MNLTNKETADLINKKYPEAKAKTEQVDVQLVVSFDSKGNDGYDLTKTEVY